MRRALSFPPVCIGIVMWMNGRESVVFISEGGRRIQSGAEGASGTCLL